MNGADGTLFGLAWAERLNERDYENERHRLKRELAEANDAAIGKQALKDAAKAVVNAVVSELAAEQAGTLKTRRLSDPCNVKGRNEALAATAAGQVDRLSGGMLEFNEASIIRIKNSSKKEAVELLSDPMLKPRVKQKRVK